MIVQELDEPHSSTAKAKAEDEEKRQQQESKGKSSNVFKGTPAQENEVNIQHAYVHWFTQLKRVPSNMSLQEVVDQLEEVELAAVLEEIDLKLQSQERSHNA